MSLPCSGYSGAAAPLAQTVGITQQTISCKQLCDSQRELDDPTFYAVVADALARIAGPNRLNIATAVPSAITPDDMYRATEDAICGLKERAITSIDPMLFKAMIIAQLNNILCT